MGDTIKWTYNVVTGALVFCGVQIGVGYSGRNTLDYIAGRNNPVYEHVRGIGPIPRGEYVIGDFVNSELLGPIVASLTPEPETETYGRKGFWIHGDDVAHDASHGCIILSRPIRMFMRDHLTALDVLLVKSC